MARKTIFDDVFRTMCQKMPHLLIPMVNEVFDTEYPDDESITQLRNERFVRNGEIITDALIQIRNHTYHLECQSNDDTNMVVRMVEYDLSIALESMKKDDYGIFHMKFPESCVVYLRGGESKSRKATVKIHYPDGQMVEYKMKTICAQDYTKDEIFQRKLLMILPFYILRYEKQMPSAKKEDKERLDLLLNEYEELFERLSDACKDNASDFTDLYNLSIKIINHVVKSNAIKRRFKDMGGKVLTLESERLISQGLSQGLAQGEILGAIKAYIKTNLPTKDIINNLVSDYSLSKDEAMEKIEEYKKENQ